MASSTLRKFSHLELQLSTTSLPTLLPVSLSTSYHYIDVLRAIEALEVGQGAAIQEVLPQLAEAMVSQIRRAPLFSQAFHDKRLISIQARSLKTKSKSDILLSKCRMTNQMLQPLQPEAQQEAEKDKILQVASAEDRLHKEDLEYKQ